MHTPEDEQDVRDERARELGIVIPPIPTLEDIYILAFNEPILHQVFTLRHHGILSLEQALLLSIKLLAERKESVQKSLEEHIAYSLYPRTIILRKDE